MHTLPRKGPAIASLAALLLAGCTVALLIVVGCTTVVTPPLDPDEPTDVYIIDYGRHASLVLPARDERVFVEYAYGEWNWYALDRSAPHNAPGTLLIPSQGTLGRRALPGVRDIESLRIAIDSEAVHEVTVSAAAIERLLAKLDDAFEAHADTRHEQPLYGLEFVHSDETFAAWHNCNHAVADWLRDLDCRVRGPTGSASFEVRSPGR